MGFWYSALLGLLVLSRIIGAVVVGYQDASLGLVEVVESDVCIIGGGSSGTYSAIRLKEMGKTVTLI
jgi:ribulose 1,5-bisphosphate synthetase/thiazole synthase